MSQTEQTIANSGLRARNKKGENSRHLSRINIDWRRTFFILLGIGLFLVVYYSPPWSAAIDPLKGGPGSILSGSGLVGF